MQYQIIPVTAFEQNCSLVWCPQTQHCALVDPGGDPELLLNAMQAKQLQPVSDDTARAWVTNNPDNLWAIVVAPWVLVQQR